MATRTNGRKTLTQQLEECRQALKERDETIARYEGLLTVAQRQLAQQSRLIAYQEQDLEIKTSQIDDLQQQLVASAGAQAEADE